MKSNIKSFPLNKKMKIWVGIDPGKGGGLSWINEDCSEYECYNTPENLEQMSELLTDIHLEYNIVRVTIEEIPVIACAGKAQYGVLKENEGQWNGLVAGLRLPRFHVRPLKWQVSYFGAKKKGQERDTKLLSREFASKMFPNETFKKKKDDGKSDSILLAKYGKDFL